MEAWDSLLSRLDQMGDGRAVDVALLHWIMVYVLLCCEALMAWRKGNASLAGFLPLA